jgi:hypothetical protein
VDKIDDRLFAFIELKLGYCPTGAHALAPGNATTRHMTDKEPTRKKSMELYYCTLVCGRFLFLQMSPIECSEGLGSREIVQFPPESGFSSFNIKPMDGITPYLLQQVKSCGPARGVIGWRCQPCRAEGKK